MVRRLNLSAALLARVAPSAEVELLDPPRVIDAFVRALPLSADEARTLSANWRMLDPATIRLLRRAKNLVTPMLGVEATIAACGISVREIAAWEEVYPHLP